MNEKFNIEGMTCTACAAAIERAAGAVPGVDSANVNFATEKLSVNYNPEAVEIQDIMDAISKIGYKAIPIDLTKNKGAIEIWLVIDGEAFMYYFFPYDAGVIADF